MSYKFNFIYKNFDYMQIWGSYSTYKYLFYYNSFLVSIC